MLYEIIKIAFPITFLLLGVLSYFAVKDDWKIAEWF